jgi:DNA-binding NtrC family response regulator
MTQNLSGHILVVDDNAAVLDTTSQFLTLSGFTVTCCSDSTKALELLGELEPDLMITDVRMPQLSGTQLVQTMRRFAVDIPVIIITGYAELDTVIEAIRLHVFDVIKKPYDYKYLSASAARAITHRRHLQRLQELADATGGVSPQNLFLQEIGRQATDLVKMLNQLKVIEDRNLENRHLDGVRAQADRLVQAIQQRLAGP